MNHARHISTTLVCCFFAFTLALVPGIALGAPVPSDPVPSEPVPSDPVPSDEASSDQTSSDQASSDPADRAVVEDTIVVSAGLMAIERRRVGSSVTVIDRSEIERRNKDTVLELLRTVPGLEVSQTGGPGKVTSVFIRGGNSSHTSVTIDGVRVNDNTAGAFDFSDLTADNLERIEIIRGPQGLLHGSEAVSGAINILTRRGEGPAEPWVEASGGTDGYSRFAVGVRGGNDGLHYSLTAARLATDGVSAASEDAGNTEDDPWTNLTVSGRVGGAFWGDGSVDLAVRYTSGDSDVDGFTFGVGPTDDLNGEQERRMGTAALTVRKPINSSWTQSLTVSHQQDDLRGIDPDDFFSNFEIKGRTMAVDTRAELAFGSDDYLTIGYRFEDREANNVGSFDESLDISSAYVEGLWSLGENADVSLGVRHDDHSIFGEETTYRAALSARLGAIARLHGSFGTGFKAPTFNDLYFPGFGNLDLMPETSEGFDLGLELTLGGGRVVVDLTYFDTSFEDLILFTFPAGFLNVASAESSGVELTLDWTLSESIRLQASHTDNDTEDLATGAPLARRPQHRSTLSLSFDPASNWSAAVTAIAVSDRIDSTGAEMDDYERVDLSLEYRMNERFRLFLRAENLFDADYAEIPGYTTPGATAILGARLAF